MGTAAPSAPDSTSITNSAPDLPYRKSTLEEKPLVRRKATGNILSGKLNLQQWRFIEFYLQGMKPYEAAKKAGYAESTCQVAYDVLLNNTDIKEEIQRRVDKYFESIGINEERIIRNTLRFSESNLFDYGYVDQSNGHFVVDLRNVPRELGYAIQEYSVDSLGRPRIKLVDKLAATGLLGKFRGMGSEKVQLTGKDGAPLTIQVLDSIVAQSVVINQQINNGAARDKKVLPEIIEQVPELK